VSWFYGQGVVLGEALNPAGIVTTGAAAMEVGLR
jgi:hypothetical protein